MPAVAPDAVSMVVDATPIPRGSPPTHEGGGTKRAMTRPAR